MVHPFGEPSRLSAYLLVHERALRFASGILTKGPPYSAVEKWGIGTSIGVFALQLILGGLGIFVLTFLMQVLGRS